MKINKEELKEMLNSMVSVSSIAEYFKCSRQAIYKFMATNDLEVKKGTSPDILCHDKATLIIKPEYNKCHVCKYDKNKNTYDNPTDKKATHLLYDSKKDTYLLYCDVCYKVLLLGHKSGNCEFIN